MISANQIRAARAWIDWSREALAQEAGLSAATIRNLEEGKMSYRSAAAVQGAFENKGFKFYGTHGFKYRTNETQTFEGASGCDEFYDDLLETTKLKSREITVVCDSFDLFTRILGIANPARPERLERLASLAAVKCLLSRIPDQLFLIPSVQFRLTPHKPMGPLSQIVYGDKTAVIVAVGKDFNFHVSRSVETAQASLRDFMPRWEAAMPTVVMGYK